MQGIEAGRQVERSLVTISGWQQSRRDNISSVDFFLRRVREAVVAAQTKLTLHRNCHFDTTRDLVTWRRSIMNDSEAGTSTSATEDFDVFLSHRGPDVKATFVAHLEDALRCAGFRPFLDARSLMKGNLALASIDEALDMAKVHIAVVSKGYAKSKYCLNELVAMVRSGKPVIPVFYDVEPADLRRVEDGPFAEAFERHKSRGRSQEKLQEWRDALRALAGITGFCLAHYRRDEAKLKQEVVNEVALLTPSNRPVEVEQYRVGLEGPTNLCIQKLDNMGAGVGILGLVGMGGVGKGTLAREIYNRFVGQKKFRCMTFLEIHRDPSTSKVQVRPTWSRKLRKQLLWDLLRVHDNTSTDYRSCFQKVSTLGPVLIVVDDVHKLGQFEALIPLASDLQPGSRIIITSRDRSILNNVGGRMKVDHCIFDVSTLGSDESNVLFNWHAFQDKEAPEEYKGLAKDVVDACDGLPLALKVIGSSLFDKRSDGDWESIWPEAIDALRQSRDVMGVLQWSYDNLPKQEKLMFVDVTCLFYKWTTKEALAYWESCKEGMSCGGILTPQTSLRNLINKNMVTLGGNGVSFKVHDLLIELGQEIGMETKTHFVKDQIAEVTIMEKQRLMETTALNLGGSRKRKFETQDFENMPRLHFLVLPDGCNVGGNFKCMSRELRWLEWRNMPFTHIPANLLNLSHVISLDFSESTKLASLWIESNCSLEGCPNLLRLNLMGCTSITKLPTSIRQSSRLEYLNLHGCKKLGKLPKSIEQLKALTDLDVRYCSSLKALPDTIGQLSRLRFLSMFGCSKLENLPESFGQLKALEGLNLSCCTRLKDLTDTIGALSNLRDLFANDCTSLVKVPSVIGVWPRLRWLCLVSSTLTEIPESIGLLMRLQYLQIFCERLQCLPKSIGDLKMLLELWLGRCDNLKRLPKSLGALPSLRTLTIWRCPIRRLPTSIGLLSRLKTLEMRECGNWQKLPTTIRQLGDLRNFQLKDCGSIEAMGALTALQGLSIWGSTSITKLPTSLGIASTLVICEEESPLDSYGGLFVGTSQVLEEDESGCLRAYHDESSGLTSLLRVVHKVGINSDMM